MYLPAYLTGRCHPISRDQLVAIWIPLRAGLLPVPPHPIGACDEGFLQSPAEGDHLGIIDYESIPCLVVCMNVLLIVRPRFVSTNDVRIRSSPVRTPGVAMRNAFVFVRILTATFVTRWPFRSRLLDHSVQAPPLGAAGSFTRKPWHQLKMVSESRIRIHIQVWRACCL